MLLAVFLGDERVGEIATAGDSVEFRLLESYRKSYPRPVIGQVFEDDLERVHRSRMRLPPFFANLLPEGALRALVANQIGVRAEREPQLLVHLGEDLPGAVRVLPEDGTLDPSEERELDVEDDRADVLKFSLAGVQLKFSAVRDAQRGLTIPAHGRGGDWIVKLPDPRPAYARVPQNEWSMMTLARQVGLDVADVELVPVGEIAGLPELSDPLPDAPALAVRRFDRGPAGARTHMEDFAQVLDVRPTHHTKYHSANFETLGRILGKVSPASAEEFVRRLVFNVAIGNGDAHVKNWSLLYPDRMRAALSPAYDLVSTIQYLPADDLGLNLAKSKRFEDVRLASFTRLVERAELGLDAVRIVGDMVQTLRSAWGRLRDDLPLPEDAKRRIEDHWTRIPMMGV